MFFIADIFTMGVQYGTRTEMCDTITSEEFQSDPWNQFAKYASMKGVTIDEYDAKSLTNTTYDASKNIRQWTYQYCTEFGFFQEPNPFYTTRSNSLDHEFWIDYCQRIFSVNISAPAIAFTNTYFGGMEITGSRIFFATASEDPWQYAGMTSIYN